MVGRICGQVGFEPVDAETNVDDKEKVKREKTGKDDKINLAS